MPSISNIEQVRLEDDGAETSLDNARGNNVAQTTARMAVEAAHRQVMEGITRDDAKTEAVETEEETK